eukprot:PhF_6_TR5575/c0_g1_i1/m.7981/K02566/nagD; NagD protein
MSSPRVTRPSAFQGFLLDMDGVLQNCGSAVPGASEFLQYLETSNLPYTVVTNECRHTNTELSHKLQKLLNCNVRPENIYTAANSARDFMKHSLHQLKGSTYVIGGPGLLQGMKDAYEHRAAKLAAGVPVNVLGKVYIGNDEIDTTYAPVKYVFIGTVDMDNTRHIERAAEFIRNGAKLLQTCPDMYDKYDDGRLCFGLPGGTVDLLMKILKCDTYNVGKPNPRMMRMALRTLNVTTARSAHHLSRRHVLFVGDSLGTDVKLSVENDVAVALVMTGVAKRGDVERNALMPTFVVENLFELAELHKSGDLQPPAGVSSDEEDK